MDSRVLAQIRSLTLANMTTVNDLSDRLRELQEQMEYDNNKFISSSTIDGTSVTDGTSATDIYDNMKTMYDKYIWETPRVSDYVVPHPTSKPYNGYPYTTGSGSIPTSSPSKKKTRV